MTTDDQIPFRPILSAFLGIVAPIFCIAVQFSLIPEMIYDLPGLSFLNTYPIFNYGVVALEILTLTTWLVLGPGVGRWGGLVAGVLLVGSLFAGLLGIVLLPFSLSGLMALIGVLGLVPLGTSFVFFRNGKTAFLLARNRTGYRPALLSLLLGAALVFCVPGVIEARVSGVVRKAIQGIIVGVPDATAGLRRWPPFLYRDRLVWAYQGEQDAVRRERLAKAYKELCGDDIESRLRRFVD
jgi:hypothetical protein